MENEARDSTEEWLLPKSVAPATVGELEERIDEAVAIARASESAAVAIGAAAIESAEQARRAADLALEASEAASKAHGMNGDGEPRGGRAHKHDERLLLFSRRADRVGARFLQLQRR
jgi:hypothetical protein